MIYKEIKKREIVSQTECYLKVYHLYIPFTITNTDVKHSMDTVRSGCEVRNVRESS